MHYIYIYIDICIYVYYTHIYIHYTYIYIYMNYTYIMNIIYRIVISKICELRAASRSQGGPSGNVSATAM